MVRQVQPLRIQKGTPGNSPTKMAPATNRTLAEVSPMAIRRNSPSFPQGNKVRHNPEPSGNIPTAKCSVARDADICVG
jgi:hypothetical protein